MVTDLHEVSINTADDAGEGRQAMFESVPGKASKKLADNGSKAKTDDEIR